MPGVYQAGVYLWKCQDTIVAEVALFGAGYHAFLEWYGVNNTCAPPPSPLLCWAFLIAPGMSQLVPL